MRILDKLKKRKSQNNSSSLYPSDNSGSLKRSQSLKRTRSLKRSFSLKKSKSKIIKTEINNDINMNDDISSESDVNEQQIFKKTRSRSFSGLKPSLMGPRHRQLNRTRSIAGLERIGTIEQATLRRKESQYLIDINNVRSFDKKINNIEFEKIMIIRRLIEESDHLSFKVKKLTKDIESVNGYYILKSREDQKIENMIESNKYFYVMKHLCCSIQILEAIIGEYLEIEDFGVTVEQQSKILKPTNTTSQIDKLIKYCKKMLVNINNFID